MRINPQPILNKIGRTVIGAALLLVCLSVPFISHATTVTPRLELNTNPGDTVNQIFKVINEKKESQTYYTTFRNFKAVDESGTPTFTEKAEDLATWIEAPSSFTVGPGEERDIPLTIRIPRDAEPGGHFAAVFLQTNSPDNEGKKTQIGVNTRIGTLLLLRVSGDFEQSAAVLEFAATRKRHNFTALPITFYYRFQNTGDDHIKPLGDIVISNIFGKTTKVLPANPIDGSVLPKSIRRFESTWATAGGSVKQERLDELPALPASGFWNKFKYEWKNFALGKYKATLKLAYGTKEFQTTHVAFTFWVIPWHFLIIVIPAALLVLLMLRYGIRYYNRWVIRSAQKKKR